MQKVKVEAYGLKKKFGDKIVLDGMDVKIYEGETFVIIGQSGVGKSVLLKHMIGLIEPDEGEIYIDGIDMSNAHEKEWVNMRRQIGMLFQGGALFDSFTVGLNILFALDKIRPDMDEQEKEDRIKNSLEMVGLPGIEDLMPSDLSGGMMKRVALARAIVADPKVVLFDEPTTGLDPIMTANVNELIMSVKSKLNTTFIVVTHDINSAKYISDRIGMVYKGRMVFTGTADELENTDNPYIEQFIHGRSEGPITDEFREDVERIKHKVYDQQED